MTSAFRMALFLDDHASAYSVGGLRRTGAINDTLGGVPVVVLWQKGTASALDKARIAGSKDIGATGIFTREVNGQPLHLDPMKSGFTDRETRSTWTVLGEAVDGPPAGQKLEPLVHHTVFWFVWSAFKPEGQLLEPQ